MSLSAEQIQDNWNKFLSRVDQEFPGRAKELRAMYAHYMDRMMLMPASGTDHFHNAFAGGYIDHILRVMDCTSKLYNSWQEMGADVTGFTYEELMFAAMHHDLGKAGFPGPGQEVYQVNESEWHRKNQGKMYKHNPNIPFTMVPDLSIWILQEFGIKMTWNEYLGIRIHDGLYDEANKAYYVSRNADSKLRNNLPLILHHADHMAARIEYEMWRDKQPSTKIPSSNSKKPSIASNNTAFDISKIFGD
jgi:hypothetical protein